MTTFFSSPNDRVFYACMGVMWFARQKTDGTSGGGTIETQNMTWLNGVQSVGVDQSQARTTMLDVGRSQRKWGTYGKQEFTITIERVLTNKKQSSDLGIDSFFYNVDGSTSYEDTHILKSTNLGFSGFNNSLRNYDIGLVYAPDQYKRLGSAVETGSTDQDKFLATIYRCCLLTGISYSIPVDGPITETLTFVSHVATQENTTPHSWDDVHKGGATDEIGDTIRRNDIDTTNSLLPKEVRRMFDLGTSENGIPILGLQNIDISATINYSDIMDVGQWRGSNKDGSAVSNSSPSPSVSWGRSEPAGSSDLRAEQNLYRQVVFPIDITCEFTGVVRAQYRSQPTGTVSYDSSTKYQDFENTDTTFAATDGDDDRVLSSLTTRTRYEADRSILIAAQKDSNYFQWNLGKRNYLEDISYSGGDTGGSNVEATISYKNSVSDFVLLKHGSIVDIDPPSYSNGLQIYY